MSPSTKSRIRRLATGRLISVTGGAAAYTALNFTVWDRTHSPTMQALSLLLTFGVAGILGPFTGALGDRFDRRKVMVWSEAVSAAMFAAMAFAHSPSWLIGWAFCSAIAEQPFFSASRAAIPTLVEREEDLSWANSLVTMGVHSGIAIGPVIGGVLLAAVGPSWVFAINALTFLVSLVLTLTVKGSFQQTRTADGGATADEHGGLGAGLAQLWRDRVLRRLSIAWLVWLLGMGMGMVADAPLAEAFGTGAIGFALIITCWGTGSVLGSAAGRWMTPTTEPVWLVGGAFGISAAAFAVGFAPIFPIVLVSLLVMGTSDGFTIVAENGIIQRRTPDAVRSRTMAAFEAVLSLGLAAAYLLAGPALKLLSAQAVYRIGGITAGVAAIMLVPLLRLRHGVGAGAPLDATSVADEPPRFTSAEELEGAPLPVGITARGPARE
jgi:MFS family permease